MHHVCSKVRAGATVRGCRQHEGEGRDSTAIHVLEGAHAGGGAQTQEEQRANIARSVSTLGEGQAQYLGVGMYAVGGEHSEHACALRRGSTWEAPRSVLYVRERARASGGGRI